MSEEEDQERLHWDLVRKSLLQHGDFLEMQCKHQQGGYEQLKKAGVFGEGACPWERLAEVTPGLIKGNDEFFRAMLSMQGMAFEPRDPRLPLPDPFQGPQPPAHFLERCDAVLHSIYREWTAEGREERDQSFLPCIEVLERLLPITADSAYEYNVCVPGCGVGRLAVELAARGYNAQMNEFSVFMLYANNFMANGATKAGEFTIAPWLRLRSNVVRSEDVVQSHSVPDIPCTELMDSGPWACNYEDPSEEEYHAGRLPRFSLQAGDFMDLYGQPQHAGQWHAVVTCWFIDAVPDIVQLIGTIHRMLRPGGVWTNFGPLLYHWVSDSCDTGDNDDHRFNSGMALPWEDIKLLLLHYGDLTFVDDDWVETTYVQRPNSMQKTTYSCKFFSIVKGEKAQTADTSIGNGNTIDTVHKEPK